MELISVIIPTHNRHDVVGRAIESVLNQSYKKIEVIVVSDGSTDNTKDVVGTLCDKDSRVKYYEYFPSKNGNVARNYGIRESSGNYIAFLDDDDEWMPNMLETMYESSIKNNSSFIYCGAKVIYTDLKESYSSIPSDYQGIESRILLSNCLVGTSSVLIKKEVFKECGVFDEELRALQDYDLWIRICQKFRPKAVPKCLLINYNSLSKKQISALLDKYEEAFSYIGNKYIELYSKLTPEELRYRDCLTNYDLANRAMRNGDPKVARAYLKKAIKLKKMPILYIYFCLTFTSYRTILKIRSLIDKR